MYYLYIKCVAGEAGSCSLMTTHMHCSFAPPMEHNHFRASLVQTLDWNRDLTRSLKGVPIALCAAGVLAQS